MANTVYSFLLVGNSEVSSILLEMHVLLPYYRSFVSDGVWPFVVAREPHHTIHVKPAVPMSRKYPGPQVVGLGVALCVPNSLDDCTLHQKQVYMV